MKTLKARYKTGNHPDRYLSQRGGKYQYKRHVPEEVKHLDTRAPEIRISLRTSDLAKARALRDVHEEADNILWASLTMNEDSPWERHEARIRLARAMGFSHRPAAEISTGSIESILERIEALPKSSQSKPIIEAILGDEETPSVSVRDAFDIYVEKIEAHKLRSKSANQRIRWRQSKLQSILNFIEVCGNLDIHLITRAEARKYYDHWMQKIAPMDGQGTHSPDTGNRRLGDMSELYKSYFTYIENPDKENPFEALRFKRTGKLRRKRLPFSHEWITNKLLKPGALAGLNDEARGIFLVMANIGARPSEIANLSSDRIILDHEVPHIKIEPDEDPDDPREIKTETSIRIIPLVGLALDVMKKHPNGFPRYRDKGDTLSGAVGKYLRENNLFEMPRQTFYSLRHSFEDRMKNAKIDAEVRKILMGHSIDRQSYGEGGSLKLRQEAMQAVSLPYDPVIV